VRRPRLRARLRDSAGYQQGPNPEGKVPADLLASMSAEDCHKDCHKDDFERETENLSS